MWQNPFLIGTKGASAEVFVFDYTKHSSKPSAHGECSPDLILTGHEKEGYGLCWSPHREGVLLSGADDALVCMWDIGAGSQKRHVVPASATFRGHSSVVEDVDWSRLHEDTFASVGDDRRLCVWDAREGRRDKPRALIENAHTAEVNSVSFNPFSEHLLLTGGADFEIALWDLRNTSARLHSFKSHEGEVFVAQWAPFNECIFASASADRRAMIWDLSAVGREQSAEDAADGPPELLFIHAGHTAKISDLAWNPNDEWVIATVSEDNIVQVWQLSESIWNSEDGEDEEGEGDGKDDVE
ncbi:hypothetical protein KFE25_001238 [Diacronema lutheri]|uniref:Histone-binding protein RBBP4 N-terminal domain-containing protein n=1 Tax=Diacronema lutheri TaxID=2081491 RepID=A0A8J6BZJ5_DIALT|nr:hypothetical protein KFE25_001238 [Diacronema lutheri]